MIQIWMTIAAVMMAISSAATFLTMLHLRFRWDVHASSVRWLFWLFFLFLWLWCTLRGIFFVWLASQDARSLVNSSNTTYHWTFRDIDRLGVHGAIYLGEGRKLWLVVVVVLGDLSLLGITTTALPLSFELGQLARMCMDRGIAREQKQIRRYRFGIITALAIYAIISAALAIRYKAYSKPSHLGLMSIYGFQFLAWSHMIVLLGWLKINGRERETVQGSFITSPLYRRLKFIMHVYAFCSLPFQLPMAWITLRGFQPDGPVIRMAGVGLILYNTAGLALSITTTCSQMCVLRTCAPCLPEDFEAQVLHQRFLTAPTEDLDPPSENVVFVYTDIESSSALWNMNGTIMGEAIEIHDDILRSTLIKHRGYEVTTVGDAFQIAFHDARDAIEYCLDVQLSLLMAKWPKEMEDAVPATAKVKSGRRTIFNGLRVRMGIHDASDVEGPLVQDVHAVTGKATYTGLSEVIAEYVGDLGSGGQILLTGRVATWLKYHRDDLSVDLFLEYMGEYPVPQVSTSVSLYQVLPRMLSERRKHFAPLRVEYMAPHLLMSERVNSARHLWNLRMTHVHSSAQSELGSGLHMLSPVPVESFASESVTSIDSDDSSLTLQEGLLERASRHS